jgi:transcription initiation factor TFIIIB Brf1 subunit/transcription initiation factor TFIIB
MLQQLENVYIPPDQIDNTPSRRDGIDAETEARLRIYGCELIQESGILLRLPQVAMATAQVLFHRFYYRRSFRQYSPKIIAMASIFLASKLEENPRRPRDVLNVFHRMEEIRSGATLHQPLDYTKQKYINMKNEMIKAERHILKELGFNLYVEHSHKFLISYLRLLNLVSNKELAQCAWNYANDCLRTIIPLRFKPEVIATACIYMAARMLQISLPESPPWWELFDATKADLDEIAWTITEMYKLGKAQDINIEKLMTTKYGASEFGGKSPLSLESSPDLKTPSHRMGHSPSPSRHPNTESLQSIKESANLSKAHNSQEEMLNINQQRKKSKDRQSRSRSREKYHDGRNKDRDRDRDRDRDMDKDRHKDKDKDKEKERHRDKDKDRDRDRRKDRSHERDARRDGVPKD